jgi:uncharacterized protein (TIGR00369 family)
VRRAWSTLAPLPGGRWLFSRLIGWMTPYTGTLGARVEALEPGYARVTLKDRHRVRNHLQSVHAVALANLAELTSGLALTAALPDSARGIPVRLTIDYHKKARGTLTAECRTTVPDVTRDVEHDVEAAIRDPGGTVVAVGRVRWRLGPRA